MLLIKCYNTFTCELLSLYLSLILVNFLIFWLPDHFITTLFLFGTVNFLFLFCGKLCGMSVKMKRDKQVSIKPGSESPLCGLRVLWSHRTLKRSLTLLSLSEKINVVLFVCQKNTPKILYYRHIQDILSFYLSL